MLKRLTLVTTLLLPLTAFAVTIEPGDFYDDVQPKAPERAGINMLTRAGVVQGYGQRMFGPTRLVNRAEFLKIAILSTPQDRQPVAVNGVGCFPDVPASAWFASYVCAAKDAGIVKGTPDGLFHPDRTVQYDEALKMLTLLYGYQVVSVGGTDWGEAYYRAAAARGTDLPIRITFDTPLTRAFSARLAAAFLAEAEGQLPALRLAENGQYSSVSSTSSSSSSQPSSSSSSSSASSVSSSSSSSVSAAMFTLPPVSHFLVTGRASDAIASGVIRSQNETAKISLAEVKFYAEPRSLERLEIVTTDGRLVATLKQKTTTNTVDYKQTFEARPNLGDRFQIPADTDVTLVLRAVVRSDTNAGFSEDLVQVRTFSVTIVGDSTNQALNLPLAGPFPKHQTAFGRILSVTRMSPATAPIATAKDTLLGSFAFTGSVVNGKSLSLSALTFSLTMNGQITIAAPRLVVHGGTASAACTLNMQAMTVSCPSLTGGVGSFPAGTPLVLDLLADVTVQKAGSALLEVVLQSPGSPEALGAVEWTDGSGNFRWIEFSGSPIISGTRFQ